MDIYKERIDELKKDKDMLQKDKDNLQKDKDRLEQYIDKLQQEKETTILKTDDKIIEPKLQQNNEIIDYFQLQQENVKNDKNLEITDMTSRFMVEFINKLPENIRGQGGEFLSYKYLYEEFEKWIRENEYHEYMIHFRAFTCNVNKFPHTQKQKKDIRINSRKNSLLGLKINYMKLKQYLENPQQIS